MASRSDFASPLCASICVVFVYPKCVLHPASPLLHPCFTPFRTLLHPCFHPFFDRASASFCNSHEARAAFHLARDMPRGAGRASARARKRASAQTRKRASAQARNARLRERAGARARKRTSRASAQARKPRKRASRASARARARHGDKRVRQVNYFSG